MAEIILVRHGQANSHATDEASYDRLSDLGHEQARWLGAHMAQTNPHFDRVVTGTLSRQIDTAAAMGFADTTRDPRLNEISYFEMAEAAQAQYGLPTPEEPADFAKHMPKVMEYWTQGALNGVSESFADFSTRVRAVIDEQCHGHGRVLLVTSGGVIGMAVTYALGLGHQGMSKIMLQIINSSYHRLSYVHDALMLGGFNATPHLDAPDRAHARTYI